MSSSSTSDPLTDVKHGSGDHKPQPPSTYVEKLVEYDSIRPLYNWLASLFVWVMLAGFIIFPATFSGIESVESPQGAIEAHITHAIEQVPIFRLAVACCIFGNTGMFVMWWVYRKNSLFLCYRIFFPGAVNGCTGFISTIANVFTVQGGKFTASSITTICVTSACMGFWGGIGALYTFLDLRVMRYNHRHPEKDGLKESVFTVLKDVAMTPQPRPGRT